MGLGINVCVCVSVCVCVCVYVQLQALLVLTSSSNRHDTQAPTPTKRLIHTFTPLSKKKKQASWGTSKTCPLREPKQKSGFVYTGAITGKHNVSLCLGLNSSWLSKTQPQTLKTSTSSTSVTMYWKRKRLNNLSKLTLTLSYYSDYM